VLWPPAFHAFLETETPTGNTLFLVLLYILPLYKFSHLLRPKWILHHFLKILSITPFIFIYPSFFQIQKLTITVMIDLPHHPSINSTLQTFLGPCTKACKLMPYLGYHSRNSVTNSALHLPRRIHSGSAVRRLEVQMNTYSTVTHQYRCSATVFRLKIPISCLWLWLRPRHCILFFLHDHVLWYKLPNIMTSIELLQSSMWSSLLTCFYLLSWSTVKASSELKMRSNSLFLTKNPIKDY